MEQTKKKCEGEVIEQTKCRSFTFSSKHIYYISFQGSFVTTFCAVLGSHVTEFASLTYSLATDLIFLENLQRYRCNYGPSGNCLWY